jgi:hypothetical protein
MTVREKFAYLQLVQPPLSLHSPWAITCLVLLKGLRGPLRSPLPGFWYTYILMSSVTIPASHHICDFYLFKNDLSIAQTIK